MIEYLSGRLVSTLPGRAVIDLGGVAIGLETPPAADDLPALVGTEVTFFTRLLVRDDELHLYGFRTMEQRKFFNLILGVSGYGPRLALSLLGIFDISGLYLAVLEEDIASLCRAPGVGRKAAQRLVLELKEKLPGTISPAELSAGPLTPPVVSLREDIIEALCALGYSRNEASDATKKAINIDNNGSREELLKIALKGLAGG